VSYQAVVRDASNELIKDGLVGMRISIIHGSATGNVVFSELQSKFTNNNGLLSLEIGAVSPLLGDFGNIDWSAGPYFIKTETDLTGGSNFTVSGTSQLLSVPFALFARSSGSAILDPQGAAGSAGNLA
jgi:hypothetical protein